MTDIDLDALEATARAATPGPWHRHPHPLDDQMSDIRGPINDDYDVVVYAESEPSDAEHIAAFDPPTVLALIARLRTAENVVKDYDANFPCDGGCNVNDGPEETCSRHGRSPSDLWNIAGRAPSMRDRVQAEWEKGAPDPVIAHRLGERLDAVRIARRSLGLRPHKFRREQWVHELTPSHEPPASSGVSSSQEEAA